MTAVGQSRRFHDVRVTSAYAPTVKALIIPPERLRALMIAEAELGERIMRALILRRVALLQSGAGGPIILGRAENGDVLRLQGFLRRNGHPHQLLSPETDTHARVLIERFHIDPGELPIVLCPGGQLLRKGKYLRQQGTQIGDYLLFQRPPIAKVG